MQARLKNNLRIPKEIPAKLKRFQSCCGLYCQYTERVVDFGDGAQAGESVSEGIVASAEDRVLEV